jgi:hypothetical protein
MTLDI